MLRQLNLSESQAVSGGFHLNLGTIITTLVVGFVSGGPVGLGIAASGIVLSEGVNNLNDLAQRKRVAKPGEGLVILN